MALVLEHQARRLRVLRCLHEHAGGVADKTWSWIAIEDELGINEEQLTAAWRYLEGEGLVINNGDRNRPGLGLSHKGLVEVERTILEPNRATPYFQPSVILTVNGTVAAIALNSPGAQQTVSMNLATGVDLAPAIAALRTLAQDPNVPADDRRAIEVAAEQVEKSKDDPAKARNWLEMAKGTLGGVRLSAEAATAAGTIGTAAAALAQTFGL